MDVFEVKLSSKAEHDLRKIPAHIVFKLQVWVDGVRKYGLREMRKRSGFHDEPLKGDRNKQRLIRLNKAYRAFYIMDAYGTINFIEIIEVNKHDY
jgi:proteic killer suppression protein